MNLLGWLVVGLVAGSLASLATGWRRRGLLGGTSGRLGCLGTIAVGVLGGLIGAALSRAAGNGGLGRFGLRSMFFAFVGSVLLLLVVGAVSGRGR